jgi:hypothetical protein
MPPRGLKAFLKKSAPAKLVGAGKFKGFALVRQGKKTSIKLKGLTKALSKRVWSSGTLPSIAKSSDPRPGGHWGGNKGGLKRGAKVDAQLSRLMNAGPAALKKAGHVYRLTKMVLSGLAIRGLEPVMAQRAVASQAHRVGTAADFVCFDKEANQLVLVELKCGHDHGITAPTVNGKGRACKMVGPLEKASDCVLHRHLAQLAVTRELFVREADTLARMGDLGLDQEVGGVLMYARDSGVEFHALEGWWRSRAGKVLDALK